MRNFTFKTRSLTISSTVFGRNSSSFDSILKVSKLSSLPYDIGMKVILFSEASMVRSFKHFESWSLGDSEYWYFVFQQLTVSLQPQLWLKDKSRQYLGQYLVWNFPGKFLSWFLLTLSEVSCRKFPIPSSSFFNLQFDKFKVVITFKFQNWAGNSVIPVFDKLRVLSRVSLLISGESLVKSF